MSVDARASSAAVVCDCRTCHMEVLARTEQRAVEKAAAEGWRTEPDGRHLCPECAAGNCPGRAAAEARVGAASGHVLVPYEARKGAALVLPDGRAIGTFLEDASPGFPVLVDFVVPQAGKTGASCLDGRRVLAAEEMARHAEIRGGTAGGTGSVN